jgi:hypothetical protein
VCITDLNSTNGTVVNGQELGPLDNIEVEVGAEVIFGERQPCAAVWLLQCSKVPAAGILHCFSAVKCGALTELAALSSAGDHFLAKYQLDEVHDSAAELQAVQQQQQPELSDQASVHKAAHINNTVDCS